MSKFSALKGERVKILRRVRYQAIVNASNDAKMARKARSWSNERIYNEIGIDVDDYLIQSWGAWSRNFKDQSKKPPKDRMPSDVEALGVMFNRQNKKALNLKNDEWDEFDSYGFAIAHFYLVKGLNLNQIERKMYYDKNLQSYIYKDIKPIK